MPTLNLPETQSGIVDLRSDTVTRPTPEMFEAMQRMPVGDDVLGDDPTVTELERLAAETMGKEAALFVPSGTMGNQIALACHCRPGDAILIEEEAHILYYEVGAPALIAGVVSWTLPSHRGTMDPDVVESRILKANLHTPGTALLCLENTHNRAGGSIIPLETMARYADVAERHRIKVHLDGARVFNAAVALGVPVSQIAAHVHSVNFCLSKGLRSPVGSVLCGDADFIDRARIWRKRLGGGMRQSGLLAACGIVSLTQMVDRLADDHRRAKELGSALNQIPGLRVDMETVETNMVLVHTETPATEWQVRLEAQGVWCFAVAPNRLRMVLHADIDDAKLAQAIAGAACA
jgi:threonine aldolase